MSEDRIDREVPIGWATGISLVALGAAVLAVFGLVQNELSTTHSPQGRDVLVNVLALAGVTFVGAQVAKVIPLLFSRKD